MVKFKRIKAARVPLVYELLQDLRKPDAEEMLLGEEAPDRVVYESIDNSRYCYVVRDKDDNLLAITGIGKAIIDVNGTKATPVWFLGTNKAYRHNRALVHYGKEFCTRWIAEVGPLCNYIWAGNEPALRYIKHLGATLLGGTMMHGEIFIPFLLSEVRQ